MSLIKKDIFISDTINENVKAEVRKTFIELAVDEKKKYFKSALSKEERFKGLLNTMEYNRKYDHGTDYFYKINLTSKHDSTIIDDEFVSCCFNVGQDITLQFKQYTPIIKITFYNKHLKEYTEFARYSSIRLIFGCEVDSTFFY